MSMSNTADRLSRREFARRLSRAGVAAALVMPTSHAAAPAQTNAPPDLLLTFPGPCSFGLPKAWIILVSDQQLEDLQDADTGKQRAGVVPGIDMSMSRRIFAAET